MGAIIKGLTSRGTPYKTDKIQAIHGEGKRRKKYLDKGYVEIQRTSPKHGTKYTDYVQSKDFDYRMKPGFPGNKKQGVLFTQKFHNIFTNFRGGGYTKFSHIFYTFSTFDFA